MTKTASLPMGPPRAYTEGEVRAMFIYRMRDIAKYWAESSRNQTVEDRCSGVVFSILALLDGVNGGLPGFKLIPCPHESDEEYLKQRGENWFPDDVDIAGELHDMFYDE
jgi:hypothetical protein